MSAEPAPDLAARLLAGGRTERGEPAGFADWLVSRRVAAELAALAAGRDTGLSRPTLRRLAVHRERVREAARTRSGALRRAGRALADAGVGAWLYKGEAFVRLTHGDPSRRPMADLDLVVSELGRERSRRALREAGFTETPHATVMHDVFVDERARGPGHPHGVAIEVHGDVFPKPHPFELDLRGVLARSSPSDVPGLRLPAPEDAHVLHAFHLLLFEQDARKGLAALRDLVLLEAACRPERLAARARALGLEAVVGELRRRAACWAGGAEAPAPRREPRARRRLALRLSLGELDEALASSSPAPRRRALSGRFAAALWQRSATASLRALAQGLLGRRGGGPWARLRRYGGALGGERA